MAVLGRNHCALIVSLVLMGCLADVATVDIDIALLHELAQLRKAVRGVNLGHVDRTQGRRGVESSREGKCVTDSDMCALQPAREHIDASLCSIGIKPRLGLQLWERTTRG